MPTELIYQKMAQVMADTVPVEKNGFNQQQGFKFRSIDDTVASVRRALVKHNVAILPDVVSVERWTYQTAKGSTMNVADVLVAYTFVAEDGSSVITTMTGQAADSGDKAVSKALSMCFKYLCFQTFLCGTDGDPDAEIVEPPAEVDSNALTSADKTKITQMGKRVNLEKKALQDAIQEALGRPITSTADLVKTDLPDIETYLSGMKTVENL